MKKSLLITALLLLGFLGFSQNKMPYIIQYQMQGDTIYHNLQSVEMIHIDSTGQEFVHGNGSDLIPLSGLDTVYIFRDEFRRYTGQMADWDEVLFSTEQIYFYKGNEETGLPKYLLNVIITDSIPNGYFVFTEFDDEGYPEYMNFNDSCYMVISSVYGEYYDAVVIAKDMSSFTMDSVRMEEAPSRIKERYQSLIYSGKALTPGSGQYAVEVSNQYLGSLHMAVGGTIAVFAGCSMLVPGVNIAVLATITLAGAAEFTSGALLAAHATDQIISDGSHTQGFETASHVFGYLSNLSPTAGPIRALVEFVIEYGLTWGLHQTLYNYVEIEAALQRAQRIRNLNLTTGRATLLDLNSHSVQLWGYVREKMHPNDYFGIFISDKRDALEVMNCMLSESNNPGAFTCDFDALEPMKDYYYRAYYYAFEFANLDTVNPWIVSKIKAFKMPGVITLEHEQGNSSNSYWLHGKFQDVANQPTHTVGFCYSYTNEEPTYYDDIMEQTVYENGEFAEHLFLNSEYDCCYYRAYAFINGEISYGEVKQLAQCGCNPTSGDWVDLGLPSGLLWATRNVGASSPEDYGSYLSWGESQPKSIYRWYTYKYGYEEEDRLYLTKYNTDSYYGLVDNLITLLPEDDAATVIWGSTWRMPSYDDWAELFSNTTCIWTTQNGVNGRCFIGSNGNCLFLPASGCRLDSSLNEAGSRGNYWSTSLYANFPLHAWNIYFDSAGYGFVGGSYRDNGLSVRAVRSTRQN